jgi:polysaccharide chain length determinant protein (PEP-CTERM system associated)
MGLMTGEGQGYFAQLSEARNALSQATLDLREAENSRDSIKKQLAIESANPSLPSERIIVAGVDPGSELDRRIVALEQKLDALRVNYTEQHPDIVAIVNALAQLKEQRDAEVAELKQQEGASTKPTAASAASNQAKSPVYQQLVVSLSAAEAKVAVMNTRVAEYSRRYAELQSAASAMPQIEAEYAQLTRDYEVNKTRYAELLKRRDSAQISGDMGDTDAAMTFRVIDPPRIVSTRPNPKLLMTLVLLAAIGGGLGVALLVSQLKPTINSERRLKELSGLRVLGTVVMNMTDSQKSRQKRGLVAIVISYMGLLSAYAAIMAALVLTASKV